MPISSSAKKAIRQSQKRRFRNSVVKNRIKKLEGEFRLSLKQKDGAKAKKFLSLFFKAIDKGAKGNILSKNKAARKKSRLSRLIKTAV